MSIQFRYEARTPAGRIERGAIGAHSRQDALARLQRRQLTPLGLREREAGVAPLRLDDKAARDLARTLAQLLRAGLPFTQALRFASDELSPIAASAAARMRETAETGEPPSNALDEYAGAEARLLKGVVRAGEASGRLAEALDMAAGAFTRAAALRARLATALIYPSFVILATLATLSCFLLVVVPTLSQAFEGAEDRLPDSTRALLGLSAWLQTDGLIAAGLVGAIIIGLAANRTARTALAGARDALLASPLALGVSVRFDYASFANLAALSLDAGVPSGTAFEAAAQGMRNRRLRTEAERAVAAIRTGERPSAALERHAQPPRALLRLMLVGEETGKLAEAMKNAATLLSTEAEQRLERLGAIAGPIVTLALGALVAGIVASLFLGLLSLSDLAAV